jgi:hypothetical protein
MIEDHKLWPYDWARAIKDNGPHHYFRLTLADPAAGRDTCMRLADTLNLPHYRPHVDGGADEYAVLFNREKYAAYLSQGLDALVREGRPEATYEISFRGPDIVFTRFWGKRPAVGSDRTLLCALLAPGGVQVARWGAWFGKAAAQARPAREGEGADGLADYINLSGEGLAATG